MGSGLILTASKGAFSNKELKMLNDKFERVLYNQKIGQERPEYILKNGKAFNIYCAHNYIIEMQEELEKAMDIIKKVAHVGVDFGFGKYELEKETIKDARLLFESVTRSDQNETT